MRQAQNGKHTSCASASTSGQLHQETDCSKCAQRARTASAAAANSGTQGREVRREASSGPALGAKCRGCRPRLQERVLKMLLSPLEKGFKSRIFFACGAHFYGGLAALAPNRPPWPSPSPPSVLAGESPPQALRYPLKAASNVPLVCFCETSASLSASLSMRCTLRACNGILFFLFNPLPTPGISARAQSTSRHLPSAAVGLR